MLDQDLKNIEIAVIGLGYVGVPLVEKFGKKYKTIGRVCFLFF
jgi:UDP-N-acetyl-D-glucosamine/UDP-N-acetyl-D-galactosamine dehydrogenase